jgi:hypothetical protein
MTILSQTTIKTLDVARARIETACPSSYTNYSIMIALHKMRAYRMDMPTELRLQSVEWLRERGYTGLYNLPLPAPGELPQ